MMSIDSAFDPEYGLDIRFYEEISRMLDYKNVIHKYMINHRQNTKIETIETFVKLLCGNILSSCCCREIDCCQIRA